jgi:hypothetical protein
MTTSRNDRASFVSPVILDRTTPLSIVSRLMARSSQAMTGWDRATRSETATAFACIDVRAFRFADADRPVGQPMTRGLESLIV